MLKVIIASLLLTSCGSSSNSESSSRESSPEGQQTGVATSYYVSSESELVACDSTRRGFLAYVKDKSEFKACLESGWTTVDVKGKDGKNGTNSVSTSDPSTWKDINTGKTWKVFGYTRYGPISDAATFSQICQASQGYYTPTVAELKTATQNGLYIAFQSYGSSYQNMWASDAANQLGGGVGYRRYDTLMDRATATELASVLGSPVNVYAGVVCRSN